MENKAFKGVNPNLTFFFTIVINLVNWGHKMGIIHINFSKIVIWSQGLTL